MRVSVGVFVLVLLLGASSCGANSGANSCITQEAQQLVIQVARDDASLNSQLLLIKLQAFDPSRDPVYSDLSERYQNTPTREVFGQRQVIDAEASTALYEQIRAREDQLRAEAAEHVRQNLLFEVQDVVFRGKNSQTNAIACAGTLVASVDGEQLSRNQIEYVLERTAERRLVATVTVLR